MSTRRKKYNLILPREDELLADPIKLAELVERASATILEGTKDLTAWDYINKDTEPEVLARFLRAYGDFLPIVLEPRYLILNDVDMEPEMPKPMTEIEWLTSCDSEAMFRSLEAMKHRADWTMVEQDKILHFMRACTGDYLATPRELCGLFSNLINVEMQNPGSVPSQQARADLVRDIYGNPYNQYLPAEHWLTADVLDMARSAYSNGDPSPEHLAITADALEEAGCAESSILNHLRGTEPCPCKQGVRTKEVCVLNHESRRLLDLIRDTAVPMFKVHCSLCLGTGFRTVKHVRGCWVVEMLRNYEGTKR